MRLTDYEIASIKKCFNEVFGAGSVILFGSRVDDAKKGGDIDLYLCPKGPVDKPREKKINFLILLGSLIGEQKIDVIMQKDSTRLIEAEALRTGIKL